MERTTLVTQPQMTAARAAVEIGASWPARLPVLSGNHVTLRELRMSDAPSLFALLTGDEVTRYIAPPPASIGGFERFIAWAQQQRAGGTHACFAVTLKGFDTAIGVFQLRETEPAFATAEWGFALGSAFWGRGIFEESAELILAFAFDTLKVHRLEARVATKNGRGNGALLKIGAVPEGTLRRSLKRNGHYLDQVLYTIVEDDWHASRPGGRPAGYPAHVH